MTTTSAGNAGGGAIRSPVPGLPVMHPEPFARYGNLRAMAEYARSFNWPIEGSLQEVAEADPDIQSVLDLLPAPQPYDDVPR